jgi:hypothetical protein
VTRRSSASAPSITDSLGSHLTYTLAQWQSTVSGQAAIFTAPVGSSAAMTVTVTNNDTGTFKDAALKVVVVTDTGQPTVGTSSKGTGPTSTTIPMAYTATATGSWGFAVISDWDAAATESGGTGTTLISTGTTADINWGQFRRTTADGVSGSTTTINATFSVASGGHAQWAAVEILPNAGAGGSTIPGRPPQPPQTRDPGRSWWGQKDRSNANLVATAANPLPMPLAAAMAGDPQHAASRWPLPLAGFGAYAQRDRSNAVLVGSGPVPADPLTLPDAVARQQLPADFTDRRQTVPQRTYVDPLLATTALLENELLGGAATALRAFTPATHADRRQTVPQPLRLADQSTPAPVLFDPTLAGLADWQLLTPATHADRRVAGAQRVVVPPPDEVTTVGTGALGGWWSEDPAVAFMAGAIPRVSVPAAAGPALFDPTQAGVPDWLLNEAATHWRTVAPMQRPVFADPTLQPMSDPTLFATVPGRVALTWPTDRRVVPWQPARISDPSFYPQFPPTDPLTVAYGVGGTYWLLYNTAAEQVDRRQVPQQRRYVSDPATLASALLENELLGGATAFVRRFTPSTHGDRRQVPTQRTAVVLVVPPVPADPTLLGYLVARIARTWPTLEGRTWRPQQRPVWFAYGATPPYVRPGRLTVAVRTVGYFTQAAAATGTITATARSTASLHPDT